MGTRLTVKIHRPHAIDPQQLITASYVLVITQPEGMLLIYKHEPEGECLSIDKSHPFKILSSSRFCIPIGRPLNPRMVQLKMPLTSHATLTSAINIQTIYTISKCSHLRWTSTVNQLKLDLHWLKPKNNSQLKHSYLKALDEAKKARSVKSNNKCN